jgi:hypothetical protein
MPRNKVYAIVEGHGEADAPGKEHPPAVTVLITKLLQELQCWTLFPQSKPVFRLRSCGDFFAQGTLENVIRYHKGFTDCAAVLVLFDLDDGCPAEKGPELAGRIRAMGELPFSVVVVCAKCEYEAWFLASLESIQPGHNYPDEPEDIRDVKGWLGREFGYRERRDQSRYTQALDVGKALERSRSFRRLYHAFEELITAASASQSVVTPMLGSRV